MTSRRNLLTAAALGGAGALWSGIERSSSAFAASAADAMLPTRESLGGYNPVVTPNGSSLPFKLVDGAKVMHLNVSEFGHEFMPGLLARCWGYNGSTPGPTMEAVQGDRVRIYVTNQLIAPTSVHWHGIRVPNGMDGVVGLTQPPIQPGKTFRYEFVLPDAGTFMYHSHFDDMTQVALGSMGMFIVHPKQRETHPPDRDYALMLSEWRIDPGAARPNPLEMTDFNVLTINGAVYPATQPIIARKGERIRIRIGNLSAMDHHPMHLHGHQMTIVETDGGIVQESARFSQNTVLVPVGATRAVDVIADNPGDWAFHCHMSHHTMNQMGHGSPNMVGVKTDGLTKQVREVVPHYMAMGAQGMGAMSDMAMQMQAPPNSVPMAAGSGQFGTTTMGGMFTVFKVRDQLGEKYEDPGNYIFPDGTRAMVATTEEMKRDGVG